MKMSENVFSGNSTSASLIEDHFFDLFQPKLSLTIFLSLSVLLTASAILLSMAIVMFERFGSDQVLKTFIRIFFL